MWAGDREGPDPGSSTSAQWPSEGLGLHMPDDLLGLEEKDRVYEALFDAAPPRQRLGRYVVLGTLGCGGMGTVLKAFDRTLDRRVAVKVLHQDLSEQHRRRLIREAQALAKLSHPNVVQVYEVGESEGRTFIVMELVRGQTLRAWQQTTPRPSWQECVEVYLQAGAGLAAAHAAGLVHRDFKPGNAIIDERGRVRVLDFGLARQADDSGAHTTAHTGIELSVEEDALDSTLTQTGVVLGTPAYMPQEQIRGQYADARSDQFGFCVSLYEALYGERPFVGDSIRALLVSVGMGRVRPACKGVRVSAALRQVLLRGLAPLPEDRWPSMDALLSELRRIMAPRRRRWLAPALVASLGAVGLGLVQYAAVGFRCDGAHQQLQEVWDNARRQQVEEAMLSTNLRYAPQAWQQIAPRLDAYAEAWVAKHTEVCEATRVTEQQTEAVMMLRMECLRDTRLALRETVAVLAEADPTRVRRAVNLVVGLPELSRCDDVEALQAEIAPPEDPEVAQQVAALREQLGRAQSLEKVGSVDQALALSDTLVREAEALGYPPLLAEALLERGRGHNDRGGYDLAAKDLERAYLLAVEHDHTDVALDAVIKLAHVVGYQMGRHESGYQWGQVALALARSSRGRPQAEADALESIASVLLVQGEHARSLAHHQQALALRQEALGPRHLYVGHSFNNIGNVLHEHGQDEQGLAYYRRSLSILEEALGPHHLHVASLRNNIGNVLLDRGDPEGALVHHQRALSIRTEVLGPQHPHVAYSQGNIGAVLEAQGRYDEAAWYHQRALVSLEQALSPQHPYLVYALVGLARTALAQDQPEQARMHAERALALVHPGQDEVVPLEFARARFALARALWPEPAERARAHDLAVAARDTLARSGGQQEEHAQVEAWLREHPRPRAQRSGGATSRITAPCSGLITSIDRRSTLSRAWVLREA